MRITDPIINLFYILESAPDLHLDLANLADVKQGWLMPSVRTMFGARHEKLDEFSRTIQPFEGINT